MYTGFLDSLNIGTHQETEWNIEIIAKILGHSVDVCRKTYIHLVEEQLKYAASQIDVIEI